MASLSINTETIALRDQPVERFRELAGMMTSRLPGLFEQPKEQRFIGQLPAGFIHGRLAEGGEYDEPLMQVALWNLFDLGVREMAINQESKSVNITKSEHTDCALGRASWISHQTVTSGRAMIAALNCIAHRTFRLNDAEVTVGVQKMEPMKQAITIIKARKKAEESSLFATVRVMASILGKKMGVETTEMRCLIELSAGMGLVAVSIDPDKNQIAFRAFSEMSALATALLQGAEWETVKTIRKQLSELSAQASGGNQPAAQASYDPTSIKRRRRG